MSGQLALAFPAPRPTAARAALLALIEMHQVGALLSKLDPETLSGLDANIVCAARERFETTRTLTRYQCAAVRRLARAAR